MRAAVRLRGRGTAQLAAFGMADAEHRIEHEIAGLWPEATVEVLAIGRPEAGPRITEVFTLEYRIHGVVNVEAATVAEARRAAYRQARDRLADSRYWSVAWEAAEVQTA